MKTHLTRMASALLLAFSVPLAAQEAAPAADAPASAPVVETPAAPVAPPAPKYKTVPVRVDTPHGPFTIELEVERAPKTAANFLRYVDQKRYDGTTFYRALTFPGRPDLGLVQGGVKSAPQRVLPPIPHEATTETGLSHIEGAVSMARGAPGSAQGDFFIILGDLSSLDANPQGGGDNKGFAVFGHVTEGLDVVRKILASPVSATEGVDAMKGQMIAQPVPLRTIRRIQP